MKKVVEDVDEAINVDPGEFEGLDDCLELDGSTLLLDDIVLLPELAIEV